MRMALEKQTMQLAWSRRRALGIPGPLQHRIHLSQPRMLLPHLMMSPHRHRMTKDKALFIYFLLFRYSFKFQF
ncbi:hypothetical protein glysoja_037782 [Glycine soja]|uniref:Uncharacterized protein n=1 Tax=Glycine soja TaxID=3848 RepID=A0A0B2R9N8_GLYSO|nr:hypothetical protein glysoja_037782 [Glycine soja]